MSHQDFNLDGEFEFEFDGKEFDGKEFEEFKEFDGKEFEFEFNTGQEFTGQEFTGQEFTGQEFTGQDFTGQEFNTGQEFKGQDFNNGQEQVLNQIFTEEEYRKEMAGLVLHLEEQIPTLREVRRHYLLGYLENHRGMRIISIVGNVVYYQRVHRQQQNF
jgi:hypothetical protein